MQGILTHIPETNHVPREYIVAVILSIIIIIIIIIIIYTCIRCVFTIIYLKHTLSVGYIMLQLFCGYSLWYMKCCFP
jgi:hypothetical protein